MLALSLLAGALPQTASAAARCAAAYTVKQGDTLATIGKKFDIKPYSIAVENKMAVPYPIFVGQRLCIPDKDLNGSLAGKYANAARRLLHRRLHPGWHLYPALQLSQEPGVGQGRQRRR